jgi:hemoglobin-like flavoprotein
LFKKFKEVTVEEMEENEHFRAHALQVTEAVSLAVATLDDMDDLVAILKQLGGAHAPYGLQSAHYDVSH